MSRHELILILGGARSGKSTWAQRLAEQDDDVLFLATAEAGDDDMAQRIARHRSERPAHWRTLEEPIALARALNDTQPAAVVVLDCVTLWVTNLLLKDGTTLEDALAELDALLAWYRANAVRLIVVSNEVGLGIVPADALSRTYREWIGRFNQRLAAEAGVVYWMMAGLALDVKALGAVPVVG